jgi:hypothetical protein
MGSIFPVAAITEETLNIAKAAFGAGPSAAQGLAKAGYNIAQGLVGINLEAPSKKLFPVYSPLRNKLARVKAPVGSTAVQWKAITQLNSKNQWPGVAENTRNGFVTTVTQSFTANFATLGQDDYVGFEALAQSKGFEDIRATAALNLLYQCMISEEKVILGGNTANIGRPASGSVAASQTTGGTLASATYILKVSALVFRGWDKNQKAGSGVGGSAGATSADGETDATSVSISTTGATGAVSLTWTAVLGAVAYNVFIDDGAGGAQTWSQTVYVNAATVTALGTGVAPNASGNDLTGSALEFDGLISSIEKNGIVTCLNNAKLTSDNAGGINEIDTILKTMWDKYRLGPSEILVYSTEAQTITKLIGASSNLAYRVVLQDGQRNVTGGIFVGSYLNKFASSFAEGFPNEVQIRIHPNMPPSTILFPVYALPYPNNQVPNVWEMECLQEYTQYEWALTQRQYEFGIYFMEVLKSYFPAAQAALTCIKAGV